ncbi:MAG: hypothetical protein K2P58_02090 [Hyphomonadaceae bacterium]|nr:hypothetical protein [Hyphomonadaceae bacterium]
MASRKTWRALMLALAVGVASCGSGSNIESPGATGPTSPPGGGGGGGPTGLTLPGGGPVTEIVQINASNTSTGNVTLNAVPGRVYEIRGRVDVGSDIGSGGTGGVSATLTIEPGVTLMADSADDMVIVNRGSRIVANGLANQPIIFTSRADLAGQNDPATASRQWAGVIILGRAPIRGCNAAVAQGAANCENAVEGVTNATGRQALYGGNVPNDNSGSFRYVQIRYPGAFLTSAAAGDDLNGLTLGGVGSGTTISHVQVHNSGDDGVEVFGGAVNMKNIVITGALDDSLDYDEGWTGALQYLVIRQSALVGGPDRMVEASNRRVSSTGDTIFTNPTIANYTMVGLPVNSANGAIRGIELNATGGTPGSSGQYLNGIVVGSTTCLFADAANTTLAPSFRSTLFDCPGAYGAAAVTLIDASGNNNTRNTPNTLAGLLPGPNEVARNATAINPATINPFFDALATPYIGAFSPTETIAANWATGWSFQLFGASACPTGTTENGTLAGLRRCVLAGTVGQSGVPASLRLVAGNIYELSGRVDVGIDRGAAGTAGVAASLTIDPGVTIFGKNSADMLIVNRGSQIFVNGTSSAPVIMTSIADVTNARSDTGASREWAGLIVLGRAPIRGCNSAVAQGTVDCQNAIEGVTVATGRQALYGGAEAADNSGRLAFLQIRYPGAFLTSAAAGDDLNGLTLGGIGSGTQVQNVQVHNSGDDGIEIFGGTVNMRRIIVTGATDDSLDYDEGWRGNAQFGIVIQTTDVDRDRMVEASNRRVTSTGDTLFTRPQLANFTFVGLPQNLASGNIRGIELNATGGTPGSSGVFVNSVVTGSTTCLFADAANTIAPNVPEFHSVLFDCPGAYGTAANTLITNGANNSTATTNTLASATVGGRPFINGANENARSVFAVSGLGSFFTTTSYIGAVQNVSDTWWQGWSCRLDATAC